ncbi:hypothetical protein AO381_0227 [Moraxella catarrhalis]|nr:hypothetical protein AO381_0227 [Moraxella catarrhalis]
MLSWFCLINCMGHKEVMHVFYPNQNQKPTKTSTTGFSMKY